jgi:hypothetical protein
MDGTINPEDDVPQDHYQMMVEYCDFNNDGSIDACEIHACLIICENEWRAENCVDTPDIYCDCTFEIAVCEGAWNCADVMYITNDIMTYYDTNNDGQINLGDEIEQDHYEILVEYCDFNNDGTLNACEIHACVIMCENEWRAANCPETQNLYCACPYEVNTCPGAWNCEDVYYITQDVMNYYDTNYNGSIDLEDEIDPEHMAVLVEYCDQNGD